MVLTLASGLAVAFTLVEVVVDLPSFIGPVLEVVVVVCVTLAGAWATLVVVLVALLTELVAGVVWAWAEKAPKSKAADRKPKMRFM